jgi:hypothetical protein
MKISDPINLELEEEQIEEEKKYIPKSFLEEMISGLIQKEIIINY